MTLRFAIPNSGIVVEADGKEALLGEFAMLGGDERYLEAHIRRSLAALQHGAAVATAVEGLNAHVERVEEAQAAGGEPIVVDDPWASAPDERVTTPVKPAYKPQGKTSQPVATPQQGDPAAFLGTDSQGWGQKFYRDQNAPQCSCGVQAIRKAATSQNGKAYQAYVCFDAGPKEAGADYHNKCNFSEFVPRGR